MSDALTVDAKLAHAVCSRAKTVLVAPACLHAFIAASAVIHRPFNEPVKHIAYHVSQRVG